MLAVPALHPAFLLRSSEGQEGQAKFAHVTIGDFKKAVALLKRKPNWDESVIWAKDEVGRPKNLFPTAREALEFLERSRGKLNAFDVETTGQHALDCRLICIGIACENGEAMCLPILKQGGTPYWDAEDGPRVWAAIRAWMADPATIKICHNGQFDCAVMAAHGAWVLGWLEDTMQLHHVVDGEMPMNLAFVGSRYLEVPFWKDLKGGDIKGDVVWLDLPDLDLRSYNLRDCLVTLRAHPWMLNEVRRLKLEDLYRKEMAVCYEMLLATIRGLYVDQARRYETSVKLAKQRDLAYAKLQILTRKPDFNPASPQQLQDQLFGNLGFPIVKQSKKGNPSTDKEAMILLALHAKTREQLEFLKALVDWRVADKQLSTWVGEWRDAGNGTGYWERGFPILGDGRLHVGWRLLPVTGRLSSSPNAQNFNNQIKRMFSAPEGSSLIGADLAQCEVLAISYNANDLEILKMYKPDQNGEKINLHTVNTTLLFGVRNPGEDTNPRTEAYLQWACARYLQKDYSQMPVLAGAAWKSARTLAKNFRFGWQYGALPDTLYKVMRSKRDPETNEQLFPWLQLGQIEAAKLRQEQIDPVIPAYWERLVNQVSAQGRYQCPLSGRIRWFRGGFKRNEILNFPTQTLVAAHVNNALCDLGPAVRELTGGVRYPLSLEQMGEGGLICQVHDMLGFEAKDRYAKEIASMIETRMNRRFSLPNFPEAELPCDKPKIHKYLDKV